MKPRLIIEQKITAFVNKYSVYVAQENGEKAQLVAFAQQKRIAFKEKVTFYADEAKTQPAFTMRAEKVLDIHGRYLVEDINGQLLGMFKKEFGESLAVSTWKLLQPDGQEVFTVRESNATIAVLRRYAGFIPFVGDIVDIVMNFFKYHFVYTYAGTTQVAGRHEKTTLFRDYYKLSLDDDAYSRMDWRVLAAMSVGLDALQSR